MPTTRRTADPTESAAPDADAPRPRRSPVRPKTPDSDGVTINGAPVRLESSVKTVNNVPQPLPPLTPPAGTSGKRSTPVIRTMEEAAAATKSEPPARAPRRASTAKAAPDSYSDPYAERTARAASPRTAAPRTPPAGLRAAQPLPPGVNHELVGLALVGLALLLLWSFFAQDGWIADVVGARLKLFFGIGAIIVPFYIGFIGYTFFWEGYTRTERIAQARLFGAALAIIAFLGFIHLFTPDPQGLANAAGGGGLIGLGISTLLSGPLQGVGAGIVLLALLIAGLMLAFNITLSQAWYGVRIGYLQLRGGLRQPETFNDDMQPADDDLPFTADGRNTLPTRPATLGPRLSAQDAPTTRLAPTKPPIAVVADDSDDFADPPAPIQAKILGAVPTPAKQPPIINGIAPSRASRTGPPAPVAAPPPPSPAAPPPEWRLPRISMLTSRADNGLSIEDIALRDAELVKRGRQIEETLYSFGVEAYVREVNTGPTVTQYALEPGVGVKVARITTLANDIALALAAPSIRIEAPVPGQSRVGIEVPNKKGMTVNLRELMESDEFTTNTGRLKIGLGQDVAGTPIVADLAKMPHLLIAGSTGSGKSVCINALVACLLFQYRPSELQFVMIDPKMVELSTFNGIPHLKFPVVTQIAPDEEDEQRERKYGGPKPSGAGMAHAGASDPNDVTPTVMSVLKWCTREMEKRYKLLSRTGHRNIDAYNKVALPGTGLDHMPYLVVMIDELADLMMAAPDEVEMQICRLAQKGRACGIHLILATQRPSVDVVTGLIKANFPTRIAFAVTSQIDSRVIIDGPGAEKLLGRGDMLYVPPDANKPARLQGTFVSDDDIDHAVAYWKEQVAFASAQKGDFVQPQMFELQEIERERQAGDDDTDELFETALEVVRDARTASTSLLQRRLRVGYNRAARLIDQLEAAGVIGPAEGGKPRPVRFEPEDMPPASAEPDTFDSAPAPAAIYREPQREAAPEPAPSRRTFTATDMRDFSGGLDDARGSFAAPPGPPTRYAGRTDGGFGRADAPQRAAPADYRAPHDDDGFPPL